MKTFSRLVLIGLALGFAPAVARSADANQAAFAALVEHATKGDFPPIHAQDWAVVAATQCELGLGYEKAQVFLCKASTTGPVSVDLIVFNKNTVVYRFLAWTGRTGSSRGIYHGDTLELGDVTGDGFPDIFFRSGAQGESDHTFYMNIVSLVPTRTSNELGFVLADIAQGRFHESLSDRYQWMTVKGRQYVVQANRVYRAAGDEAHGLDTVNYQYLAYRWDNRIGNYVVCAAGPSPAERENPLTADADLITGLISATCEGK